MYRYGRRARLPERSTREIAVMTKLLEEGIKAVRKLPPERQDDAGQILLRIAEMDEGEYMLTPEQIENVKVGMAQADRGDFATEEEMEAVWKSFGL